MPSDDCIVNLKSILCYFQACSGLKINFHKYSIIGIGTNEDNLNRWRAILDCDIAQLLLSYLGFPLHFKRTLKKDWNPIVDKLQYCLENWKGKYLSLGGRVTLLNAVLSAIPTYYLSTLHLPAKVVQKIDGIKWRFLWSNGQQNHHGYHLCNWFRICRSRTQDGLGIINLKTSSITLKSKLVWKFLSNTPNYKWIQLLKVR